jgi:hypothetical protein
MVWVGKALMLGFKAFHSAAATVAGIESGRMIRKGQFGANDRRCCTSLWFEDSLGESSGLDGCDEQAAPSPLSYHELAPVQPCA